MYLVQFVYNTPSFDFSKGKMSMANTVELAPQTYGAVPQPSWIEQRLEPIALEENTAERREIRHRYTYGG